MLQQEVLVMTTETLLTALAVLVVSTIVFHLLQQHYSSIYLSRKYGMPVVISAPEGRALPVLGHALQFLNHRPWDLLCHWHQLYGPIFSFPLLGATYFSIASPPLIKVVLQSKIAAIKKDVIKTMKPFLVILGKGIVTSEDESWMKQRLKMSHPLRRDVLELIPAQTLLAVQRWMQQLDGACQTGETVPVGQSLRHLTLQVISGTFLSLSAEESDSTFATMYLPIVDEANTRVWHPYRCYLFFMPFFWKHLWNVKRLNDYVSKIIQERWTLRRQEAGQTTRVVDILDRVLLVEEKEFDNKEENMPAVLPAATVHQLRDEMKTFMLAGHETSAAMMTWALYEMVGNINLVQAVAKEADTVFSKTVDWAKASISELPNADQLAQLVFSEACLKESLRKYSVVPIVARRTIQDLHMDGGYFIPKGSSLVIDIHAVHHNPDFWPKPMVYDPSRFLNGKIPEPFTFLPFIAGPRNCLGQYLALLESKMVISLVTQRYHFSLPQGEEVLVEEWKPGQDPRHRFMVPAIPQKELMVHVKRANA